MEIEDDKFHKYPKIRILGDLENKGILEGDIIIEEKMDGANFRFMFRDDRIIWGSRSRSIGDSNQDIGGSWRLCVELIKSKVKPRQLGEFKGLLFFGECMVAHSMAYDWERIPRYLGYDIYDIKGENFLDYATKYAIFQELGLEMVPLVASHDENHKVSQEDLVIPQSEYVDAQAEGIVIKNYKKQLMAKMVTDTFKEKNALTFGGSKKHAQDDTNFFVLAYCTNARIDKIIFKLLDEGKKLEMQLMHDLPHQVTHDIWEENWKEIVDSKKIVNLRNFKKQVGLRCLHVLKQMIEMNALEGV